MKSQHYQYFNSPAPSLGLLVSYNSPASEFSSNGQAQPPVMNKALEAAMPNTTQQANTDGIFQPQQFSTNLRYNAGMPLFRSIRPINASQSQSGEMNNAFIPNQPYDDAHGNGFNYHNIWRQQPLNGMNQDFDQQIAHNQQIDSRHQGSFGAQNGYNQDTSGADEHAYLQQRLHVLAQSVSNQQGLSAVVVAGLTAELQDLSQRHMSLRRILQNEHKLAKVERQRLTNTISTQQRLIQNALAERDRACEERDRLQAQLTAVQGRQLELERRLEDLEKKNAATIDFLRKQIRFKDEQLNGKRSLWMRNQNHRNFSTSQTSDTRDACATSNTQNIPDGGLGYSHADNPEGIQSIIGPSKPTHHPTKLLIGSPGLKIENEFWPYRNENAVDRASPAESCRSSVEGSKALIPFKTEDQIAQEFREDFDSVYKLIDNWVENYAHTVNNDMTNDQELSHDKDLWPFMLSCTYSNFADAHEHTILLLRNPAARSSFVKRLIIQYLYTSVWKATAFGAFNPKYKEKLEMMEVQMKVKGLEPTQRANLVAAQTHCVQCIIENKGYLAFRSQALTDHAKGLRGKVGPLLDEGVIRADAGKALGLIVVRAWDLSAKLYTSNYTFLFNFPVCGSRFLHPTMECDDPNVDETDLQLHIRQAKIKLAIKPIITMRNDRHMTISAKKVHNAHVLIFP